MSLTQASKGRVTVDYLTIQRTASQGTDYEETTGTLTFAPGEVTKVVSVPIIDDFSNDSGETFELVLNNAQGAVLDTKFKGVGTIYNDEILEASFHNGPRDHDGSSAFTVDVHFTNDIAITTAAMRDHAFTITGGDVTAAGRLDSRDDRWRITVEPDGDDDVVIRLTATGACTAAGAICGEGDNPVPLTNSPSPTRARTSPSTSPSRTS